MSGSLPLELLSGDRTPDIKWWRVTQASNGEKGCTEVMKEKVRSSEMENLVYRAREGFLQ